MHGYINAGVNNFKTNIKVYIDGTLKVNVDLNDALDYSFSGYLIIGD